jgi:cytochrome d ubiquinol oxidase subunit I
VGTSLVAFFLVYALLGAVDIYLLFKFARKGPEAATAAAK